MKEKSDRQGGLPPVLRFVTAEEALSEEEWEWREAAERAMDLFVGATVRESGLHGRILTLLDRLETERARVAEVERHKDVLFERGERWKRRTERAEAAMVAAYDGNALIQAANAARDQAESDLADLRAAVAALADEWRSLPVWGPDERGLMILDEVDRDSLLNELRALVSDPAAVLAERDARVLREFADTLGVNVSDEDDEWWQGYRQAQRDCLHKAVKRARSYERADRIERQGGDDE